jgi:hypothetical protein
MILHVENPKDTIKTLLKLLKESSKLAGYESNMIKMSYIYIL